MCVEQSGRTIEARCKEHQKFVLRINPKILRRQENSIAVGRRIDFIISACVDHLTKGVIEMRLNANFDRDGAFALRRNWDPVNNKLNMKQKQA